jgi:hypothetical protein
VSWHRRPAAAARHDMRMQSAAPGSPVDAESAASWVTQATLASPSMDREFIARNQIVERYIGGRLPLKGAQDFERFCREHPQLLDEIGLTERIHAALRLLDASGQAAPWEQRPKRWWERLPVLIGTAILALSLALTCVVIEGRLAARERTMANLQQRAKLQPLDPAKSTRAIAVIPSRTGPSQRRLVAIGGTEAQMADLKIDLSWSQFTVFRVTIDRIDQGRVGVLHNLQRDSSGNLHIELNSTALGTGDYQLTIEGLTWRGEAVPQAWAMISFAH